MSCVGYPGKFQSEKAPADWRTPKASPIRSSLGYPQVLDCASPLALSVSRNHRCLLVGSASIVPATSFVCRALRSSLAGSPSQASRSHNTVASGCSHRNEPGDFVVTRGCIIRFKASRLCLPLTNNSNFRELRMSPMPRVKPCRGFFERPLSKGCCCVDLVNEAKWTLGTNSSPGSFIAMWPLTPRPRIQRSIGPLAASHCARRSHSSCGSAA